MSIPRKLADKRTSLPNVYRLGYELWIHEYTLQKRY